MTNQTESETLIWGHLHQPYLSRWKLCQLRKKRRKKITQGWMLHGFHMVGNHETSLEYAERKKAFAKWLDDEIYTPNHLSSNG